MVKPEKFAPPASVEELAIFQRLKGIAKYMGELHSLWSQATPVVQQKLLTKGSEIKDGSMGSYLDAVRRLVKAMHENQLAFSLASLGKPGHTMYHMVYVLNDDPSDKSWGAETRRMYAGAFTAKLADKEHFANLLVETYRQLVGTSAMQAQSVPEPSHWHLPPDQYT